MPFGIELSEIFLFGRQFGLALSGASALWGTFFVYKSSRNAEGRRAVYRWIASRMFIPFFTGLLISAVSWAAIISSFSVFAHEGIVLVPSFTQRMAVLNITTPLFFVLFFISFIGFLVLKKFRQVLLDKLVGPFFLSAFVLIFFLISAGAWAGQFDRSQFFFIGHSFHSIFTLGTVLVLDFLFLISQSSPLLKQHIYPSFALITKVILVGLGIDFLSVALIFDNALQLTPKFFFMQTVVGMLIINGVLLGGPLAKKLAGTLKKPAKAALNRKWSTLANISGTLSLASWFSITLVDHFEHLTLNYAALFIMYCSVFITLFIGHSILDKVKIKAIRTYDVPH